MLLHSTVSVVVGQNFSVRKPMIFLTCSKSAICSATLLNVPLQSYKWGYPPKLSSYTNQYRRTHQSASETQGTSIQQFWTSSSSQCSGSSVLGQAMDANSSVCSATLSSDMR